MFPDEAFQRLAKCNGWLGNFDLVAIEFGFDMLVEVPAIPRPLHPAPPTDVAFAPQTAGVFFDYVRQRCGATPDKSLTALPA
jgi:hypothetical protein